MEVNKEYVEGCVKVIDKFYGFLECEKESFFILFMEMKKVMYGDIVKVVVKCEGDKVLVEIDSLIELMLDCFIV